jgi:multisubunit Na+/H+ antiporter MnhB subunit
LKTQSALKNIGFYFGIIGALAFVVFILIFGEDWTQRYRYLSYLMPLPVISLLIAKPLPLLGGLLLMAAGVVAGVFDVFFSPGYPGQVAGRGLGNTSFFVAIHLVISDFSYLILGMKSRSHLQK